MRHAAYHEEGNIAAFLRPLRFVMMIAEVMFRYQEYQSLRPMPELLIITYYASSSPDRRLGEVVASQHAFAMRATTSTFSRHQTRREQPPPFTIIGEITSTMSPSVVAAI